ncbi:MAG: CHASE2 domain-containing protein, partial [Leptolyngbyaceae cyanobacterium]
MRHLPELRSGLKSAARSLQSWRIAGYGKVVLLLSLLTTGSVVGMRALGWLQVFDLNAYDQMLRQQPTMPPESRVVVVGITEEDLREYGWPIPDHLMAQALQTLQSHQPRVIGFDLYRDIFHPPGTEQLRSQLDAANVIVIEELGGENAIAPPPGIPPERVGFNNLLTDGDKVVRRNLMVVLFGDEERHSFSLRVSQAYLTQDGVDLTRYPDSIQLGETTFLDLQTTSGGYHLSHSGYQILNQFLRQDRSDDGPDEQADDLVPGEQISLHRVLSGDVDADLIHDRIVLVGTVAPSLKDLVYTPYSDRSEVSRTPGVIIHAQFTSQILRAVLEQERLIWMMPTWKEWLWILGWAILGGTTAWMTRNPILVGVSVIATGGLLIGSCYFVFLQAGWIPLWPALIALVATSGAVFTYESLYRLLYDTLTGLPQKTMFLRFVGQSMTPSSLLSQLRSPSPEEERFGAMLCLDLNGFKRINESLGHEEGDRILLAITQRIKRTLPRHSQLSRLVSDKFAVWTQTLPQGEDAIALAHAIQDNVKQPIYINGQEVVMSASVGIAIKTDDSSGKADELLRDAQTAMHQAKSRGKSQIEVFNRNMRLNIIAHFQTEADLRYAIERQELRTYYQPFISLQTGNIAGFEALIRWQHPQHGLVSPGKFIPVAEDTDLIIPIGHWILQEACQQMRRWHTA